MVSNPLPIQPGDVGCEQLFASPEEAALVVDVTTEQIVLWSAEAARLFGYSVEEAVGMSLELLVPEEYRAEHLAGFARYRENGHGAIVDAGLPLEVPALRRDGSHINMALLLTPRYHVVTNAPYLSAVAQVMGESES